MVARRQYFHASRLKGFLHQIDHALPDLPKINLINLVVEVMFLSNGFQNSAREIPEQLARGNPETRLGLAMLATTFASNMIHKRMNGRGSRIAGGVIDGADDLCIAMGGALTRNWAMLATGMIQFLGDMIEAGNDPIMLERLRIKNKTGRQIQNHAEDITLAIRIIGTAPLALMPGEAGCVMQGAAMIWLLTGWLRWRDDKWIKHFHEKPAGNNVPANPATPL